MSTEYLPARFRPHTSARDTLLRPRLVEHAVAGPPASAALTLCLGPAGFGKTTLLCDVAEHLSAVGWRTAWLNCEPADRDVETFLESLSAAIERTIPGLRLGGRSLDALCAALYGAPQAIALFVDEYEKIACPELEAVLESLARVGASRLRLFVAGRALPADRFVRTELEGLVRILSATDLRFDPSEARALLGGEPTDELVAFVHRAEGWPFVLQLARLHARVRRRDDNADPGVRFPRERIFQFLAAEVMSSLGGDLQDFVVQTSVLDVFGAPEAEAITGRGDCVALMRRLESLEPIVLVEPDPIQVRFHPLLQDYLRTRLAERGQGVVADVERRIAEHFARAGRMTDAIEHAIAGGSTELAIALVERAGAIRYVLARGVTQARQLLRLLPDDAVTTRLRLRLMAIGCLADHQRGSESSIQLAALEAQLERGEYATEYDADAALDLEVARGIVGFIRIEHEIVPPDWSALRSATQRVRSLFCDDPRMWIAPMVTEARRLLRHGSLPRAELLIDDLIDINERGHRLRGALDAWMHRALWAQARGDLSLAADIAGDVLGKCLNLYGHEASHEGQLGSAVLGHVLYLRGDIDGALHHFRNLEVKQPSVQFEVYSARYVGRALCELAAGRAVCAHEQLQHAVMVGRERGLPQLDALATAVWVQLLAEAGEIARAERLAEEGAFASLWTQSGAPEELPWVTRVAIARGHVALSLASGRSAQALERASRAGNIPGLSERRLLHASVQLTVAKALLACGQRRQAQEHVERVLIATEGSGATRLFLEQGSEVAGLVRQVVRAGGHPASPWAAQILDQNACVDRLTPRQRDILEQLAIRRTTKEIARHLGLSPETVKHHLKVIFERLDVTSREEAVAAMRRDA